MHDHSGLFVEHKHILILIDNVQRDILRKDLQSPPLVRHHKSHHIARTDNVVRFDDLVVDSYVISLDCQLDTMAGSIFHVRGQILVHPDRHLTGGDVKAVVPEHLLLLVLICDFIASKGRIKILYRIFVIFIISCIHYLTGIREGFTVR